MIKALLLSGGATRGYYELGCMNKYDLKHVERYIGTSVGGLICLMHSCGFDETEIFDIALSVKVDLPKSNEWLDVSMHLLDKYGVISINPYIERIEKSLYRKYGYVPTMQQLKNITGKELILST